MNIEQTIKRILREEVKTKSTNKEFTKYKDSKFNTLREYTLQAIVDNWDTLSNHKNDNIQTIKYFVNNPSKIDELLYDDKGLEDGYHRLTAMKILKKLKFKFKLIESLKNNMKQDKNIDGGRLKMCSTSPMTGYYRDGYCRTGKDDVGSHTVCAKVTEEFLDFTNSMGNNLDMLEPGDKWCLCAKRWEEANKEGVAPTMIRSSTNIKTLDIIDNVEQELDEYSRTLKNARQQGVGLRFSKSAIKANPLRFRPYNR